MRRRIAMLIEEGYGVSERDSEPFGTAYSSNEYINKNDNEMHSSGKRPDNMEFIDNDKILDCMRMLENHDNISSVYDIINKSHMGIALYKYHPQKDMFEFEIWSQGLVEITGYSYDDVNNKRIIADNDRIISHKERAKNLMQDLQCTPEAILADEMDIISAKGEKKIISMSSTGSRKGQDFYILSLMKDVTYEREVERKIRESEKMFKDFFELSPEASFIYADGRILLVNNAAVKLLGFDSKEQLINLNILDIVHSDYRRTVELLLKQKEFDASEVYLTRLVTHKGQIIDAEVAMAMLDYDGQKAIYICIRNVTKRMEAERRLIKSKESYRRLLNLLPDPIYVYDGKKIIYVNDSVIRLMNVKDKNKLIGKRHRDLINIDEGMINLFGKVLNDVIKTNNTGTWEGPLQRKNDGEYIYVSVSVIKVPIDSKSEFMIIVKDLEELKRNEELKIRYEESKRQLDEAIEYDKQRTEFFCNLSHELRTPINVILGAAQMSSITMNGYSQLMEDERLNRYMDIIKQNCMRLIRMTNNLIDITKIDFGYFDMKYVESDIVSAVEEITMSVSGYAQNKGIQLVFDTDIEEKTIAFDYEKLERILLNLLSNAVKFTESGGYIYVNVKNGRKYISISVKDTGIGIPENMQKRVFERFVQVDKSLSRSTEGSGIGLALVKYLVEMHEGSISLKSVPGEGSEFTVKIPCFLKENVESEDKLGTNNEECLERAKVEFSDIYF